MKLISLLYEILDENRVDFLKNQFVGKILDNNEFNGILDVDPTNTKKYTQWLINVYNKSFKQKGMDINDFIANKANMSSKIDFFEQNKALFVDKDINKYSLPELNQAIDKVKQDLNLGQTNVEALSPVDIDKLSKVGIKYLGEIDGYQVIKIPKGNDSPQTHKVYANVVCQGKTHICTASNYNRFVYYTVNDNLFILLNSDDEQAPYHISHFTHQVSDKNDNRENIRPEIKNIANKLK